MPRVVELLIALAHAVYRPATDDAYGQFRWNGLDLTSEVRFGCNSALPTREARRVERSPVSSTFLSPIITAGRCDRCTAPPSHRAAAVIRQAVTAPQLLDLPPDPRADQGGSFLCAIGCGERRSGGPYGRSRHAKLTHHSAVSMTATWRRPISIRCCLTSFALPFALWLTTIERQRRHRRAQPSHAGTVDALW